MTDPRAAALDTQHAIDREVELVTSAINLVGSGAAPSTMVVGLRLTDAVIEVLELLASQRGLVLEPLWSADESTSDLRVRRREPVE